MIYASGVTFVYAPGYAATEGPFTAEEAVQVNVNRASLRADGALERDRAKIEELQGMIGRLIERLKPDEAAYVLGCNWEPKE